MEKHLLPCMFKQMFGIDCIGCGIQRSILLLFKGQFADAFYMFPAIYTTLLLALSVILFIADRKHNHQKMVIGLAIANALIMIIAYVYKMRFIY